MGCQLRSELRPEAPKHSSRRRSQTDPLPDSRNKPDDPLPAESSGRPRDSGDQGILVRLGRCADGIIPEGEKPINDPLSLPTTASPHDSGGGTSSPPARLNHPFVARFEVLSVRTARGLWDGQEQLRMMSCRSIRPSCPAQRIDQQPLVIAVGGLKTNRGAPD